MLQLLGDFVFQTPGLLWGTPVAQTPYKNLCYPGPLIVAAWSCYSVERQCNRMLSIEWCHFKRPFVTRNPYFKDMILFVVEYLRNGTR